MKNPAFGLVTAKVNGELVGFAYGIALSGNTGWWSRMMEPLPEELTAEWNGRTFAVIDLAVRQDYRKQGIGRALLDTLLANRTEERASPNWTTGRSSSRDGRMDRGCGWSRPMPRRSNGSW
jgi:GNAT superfamily N-acetyltransferase